MYTLTRYSYNQEKEVIILDLYDHKHEKGVALYYSLYHKELDRLIISILSILTDKTLDLNTWDDIVHQFIKEQ